MAERFERTGKRPPPERHTLPEWQERVRTGRIYGQPGRKEYSFNGLFCCQLCEKELKQMTNTHASAHGLTVKTYKELLGLNRTGHLSSPELHEERSKRGRDNNTIGRVEGKRPRGTTLDKTSRKLRLQAILENREKQLQLRKENILPNSSLNKDQPIRLARKGYISVYGKKYYVAKGVKEVTITSITDTTITISWLGNNDQPYQRVYLRKDQH